MSSLQEIFRVCINLLSAMTIADFFDIAIFAFIIYKLLTVVRKTSASAIIKGVFILIILLWLSNILQLSIINFLLGKAMELGIIAIIVLFQPEIRRFLSTVGSGKIHMLFASNSNDLLKDAINSCVEACGHMANTKTGALIVFERSIKLNEYIKSGTLIDSEPSADLFLQIFYPNTPLHDGAVIVCDGRIAAAGAMLPMSTNMNLSRELGMRHRAGIGLSEKTDAVCIMVSEETGTISVAVEGMLKRNLDEETFKLLLENELYPEKQSLLAKLSEKVKKNV